jgi:hypothetical protein
LSVFASEKDMRWYGNGDVTDRPDFRVNSPKSRTPFLSAASIKATFSASTAVDEVEDLATLIILWGLQCMHEGKEEEEERAS